MKSWKMTSYLNIIIPYNEHMSIRKILVIGLDSLTACSSASLQPALSRSPATLHLSSQLCPAALMGLNWAGPRPDLVVPYKQNMREPFFPKLSASTLSPSPELLSMLSSLTPHTTMVLSAQEKPSRLVQYTRQYTDLIVGARSRGTCPGTALTIIFLDCDQDPSRKLAKGTNLKTSDPDPPHHDPTIK